MASMKSASENSGRWEKGRGFKMDTRYSLNGLSKQNLASVLNYFYRGKAGTEQVPVTIKWDVWRRRRFRGQRDSGTTHVYFIEREGGLVWCL